MPVATRRTVSFPGPVALKRISAMTRIRVVPQGRRLARKLCMDEDWVYQMHFEAQNGVVTYHVQSLNTASTRLWTFRDLSDIPEFVYEPLR